MKKLVEVKVSILVRLELHKHEVRLYKRNQHQSVLLH